MLNSVSVIWSSWHSWHGTVCPSLRHSTQHTCTAGRHLHSVCTFILCVYTHTYCVCTHIHTLCVLEGCGFTGFQVFTGLRCSRLEKPVRSKKTEKPVFTGDITTNSTPPELEASSMAESQEKFVANPKGKAPTWEFFCFRCKDGQVDSTKAYCTECIASVKLGGGISNMSAHVHRHLPLLLNKPFGKAKVTSVRNPPGPAPIDSNRSRP